MLSETSASALRFTRVVGWFGCCRSCGSAEVDDLRWRDVVSSAPATTTWLKADGPRSLFCRLVSSGVSSNSAGSGNLDLSTAVADVDGADCWGSAKIRETLIRAGDCFEGACHVGIKFLFVAASSSGSKLGSSATSDISTASVADLKRNTDNLSLLFSLKNGPTPPFIILAPPLATRAGYSEHCRPTLGW